MVDRWNDRSIHAVFSFLDRAKTPAESVARCHCGWEYRVTFEKYAYLALQSAIDAHLEEVAQTDADVQVDPRALSAWRAFSLDELDLLGHTEHCRCPQCLPHHRILALIKIFEDAALDPVKSVRGRRETAL